MTYTLAVHRTTYYEIDHDEEGLSAGEVWDMYLENCDDLEPGEEETDGLDLLDDDGNLY